MRHIIVVVVVAVVAVVAYFSLFAVDETEQALVLQFGEHKRTVRESGLHMKIPFLQNVVRYDKRVLRYDASPSEFLTQDKKTLVVDAYARYRITDPLQFFETMGDQARAHARLDAIISSELREAVASHEQFEIITDKREPIMAQVGRVARDRSKEFGVELLDVRIKRTDFPDEIAESIYSRMRAERNRISSRYRSEGEEESRSIRAQADKERSVILAEARRRAEVARGDGDAKAIRIFADALEQDPEFYTFLRSLRTYRESITEGTTVVLSADSPLFQYLEDPEGRAPLDD